MRSETEILTPVAYYASLYPVICFTPDRLGSRLGVFCCRDGGLTNSAKLASMTVLGFRWTH